jgi:RNA polymerase sigma factor (TIGR02999 family)
VAAPVSRQSRRLEARQEWSAFVRRVQIPKRTRYLEHSHSTPEGYNVSAVLKEAAMAKTQDGRDAGSLGTLAERMAAAFEAMRAQGTSTREIYGQLYADVRLLAHKRVGDAPVLSPTSAVHVLWIRVMEKPSGDWDSGIHFVRYMARAMQNLLIDAWREPRPDTLPPDLIGDDGWETRLIVSQALEHLEAHDPRQAEIVRLVVIAGLTQEEAAAMIDCCVSTVKKEYRKAKAWLKDHLENRV